MEVSDALSPPTVAHSRLCESGTDQGSKSLPVLEGITGKFSGFGKGGGAAATQESQSVVSGWPGLGSLALSGGPWWPRELSPSSELPKGEDPGDHESVPFLRLEGTRA